MPLLILENKYAYGLTTYVADLKTGLNLATYVVRP